MVKPVTLTEAFFHAPDWLAALLSNYSVYIKGRVGMDNLAALRDLCPPGVLAWTLLEVPYTTRPEAYEFLAGQMPIVPQVVPRPVYIIPNCPVKAVEAALHLKVERPWVQWVAEVPDLPFMWWEHPMVMIFNADTGTFWQGYQETEHGNDLMISMAARWWAHDVLPDWTDPAKVRERVAAEVPAILTATFSLNSGNYRALVSVLRGRDRERHHQLEALFQFGCHLDGFTEEDRSPAAIAARYLELKAAKNPYYV